MYYFACCCNCFRWNETSHTMPAECNVPLYWYLQISENFKLQAQLSKLGESELKNVCQQCLPKIWCYGYITVDTISVNWQWSNYCSEIASYHWWCFWSMVAMGHSLGPNWRGTPLSSDRDAHHVFVSAPLPHPCSLHSLQQDFPFRNKMRNPSIQRSKKLLSRPVPPHLFFLSL